MKVRLEVVKGPEVGRIFEFTKPETFIVGRGDKDRTVHFKLSDSDPYVSRQHFMLEVSPPKVFLKDLDSTNTPCINGIFKVEADLHDGDIIEVGYTQLKIHISWEIKTKTVCCRRCGESMVIMDDEITSEYCSKCEKETEAKKTKLKGLSEKWPMIWCTCGKDLTEQANSDGRAEDLRGIVQYQCERCIQSLKDGEDAGKKIDDYEVVKTLGHGAMGKVYQVYHKPTARVMAMKQILRLSIKELHRRFEREVRLMSEVRHINTIRFIDSGLSNEGPYLLIELASHGNLECLIKHHKGFLSPQEIVPYIIDSLKGIEFIHQKGIIHRDLKPENILLQGKGDGALIPKVADFGLAKKYSEAGGSHITRLNVGIGTLLYMSPEQIKDTRNVREPADIYAMGVTLYYMLTGEFPFNFPTIRDIKRFLFEQRDRLRNMEEALALLMQIKKLKSPVIIILTEEPIPIEKRKPDIPIRLARIVNKAIKKDIAARFRSASEFRLALEEAL